MVRSAGTVVENNFVNGLVTEATGMNFPENACTAASNVIFKETGEVTRRLGYDYELAHQVNSISRSSSAIVEYEWKAAGGQGDINFVVQQIGDILYFYRVLAEDSLSHGLHGTTILLSTYAVPTAPAASSEPCSFATGKGYLFVTNKYCEPFYVSYTPETGVLMGTAITIQTRDFEGVDDGLTSDERPTVLTEAHEYNLLNQGWDYTAEKHGGGTAQVIDQYFTDSGMGAYYPSNSEQWWTLKNTDEQFDGRWADRFFTGNSLAPKGHYIFNEFLTTRSSVSSRIGTVTERSASFHRPSCCAFFAGRVWYAGVEYINYTGNVYYSQIIERDDQLGQCYQSNDPTSENLSDLLDTDGGVARILDIGTVYKMFATQKALLVFASNGIWSISGSDVASFKATDYTIKKISAVAVTSGLPFVDVLGVPIFWTEDGIWTVAYESGDFSVISVSDKRIKRYFKEIPRESKRWAKAAFNSVDKIVQWVFSSTAPDGVDQQYTYDSILNLNVTTGAFYPWTIFSANKTVNGIVAVKGPSYGMFDTIVDGSGDTVVDGSGNTVISVNAADTSTFKYFTTKLTSGITYDSVWSVSADTRYLDWVTDAENYDYSSSFTSGYRLHAEGNKEYQANYVTFICSDETGSSAFVQGVWDFSNNTLSKKWTTAQQVYNSTPAYRDYRIRRIKIRGWGKALQFRIYSATGVPFNIIGWSSFETANPLP